LEKENLHGNDCVAEDETYTQKETTLNPNGRKERENNKLTQQRETQWNKTKKEMT
jgi:hypothetical protein